jgi:diguanylate cyclase (GGDEF)-like protein
VTVHAKLLTQVLAQIEHVNEVIKQSAEELSSAIAGMKHELLPRVGLPKVEIALDKSDDVRRQLQAASERLTAVNEALADEVRDRTMVDHQLAAAMEQEEGARNAALHDKLTDLPNRALFKDRLEHGIAQAKRHGWMIAVMFVDLDEFKSINDTYGHQAGDAVLQAIAMRLKQNIREEDTVSRYGGDEFLYLLTHIREQKDIEVIARKILKAIQAPCNVSVRDVRVDPCVGASIGISLFPKDGVTATALIKSADEAMYETKQSKSGYTFAK